MWKKGMFALIAVGVASIAPAGAADREFCNQYKSGTEQVVLLIDRTSESNPAGNRAVERARTDVLAPPDKGGLMTPGQRLDIIVLTDNASDLIPIYSDCMPGRPFSLTERPVSKVDQDYDTKQFVEQVETAVKAEMKKHRISNAKSAIIDIVVGLTRGKDYRDNSIKTLVMASDLLDNVDLFGGELGLRDKDGSLRELDEHAIQSMIKDLARRNRYASLKGASVYVYGFGFDDDTKKKNGKKFDPIEPRARASIELFWNRYFLRSGAKAFAPIY